MRFDIALMCGGGLEAAFDQQIGLGETGSHIAVAKFTGVGDVGRHARRDILQRATGLHDRGAGLHRLVHIGNVGKLFVSDLDRLKRGLGNGRRGRGDGGDGMAIVQRLVPGHAVVLHIAERVIHVQGKSAAVTTARTPGIAAAAEVSMATIRAWAWGERRIAPVNIPGADMSAPYWARPVTLSTPSGRFGRVPT